jgi:uncharacterized protein
MPDWCDEPPPELLRQGIAQLNRGEFFEQHETLEELWRAERRDVRYLYQGILQIGVAFHHLGNANWRGATGLLSGGIEKVSRFRPVCMGVDTGTLTAEAQACLDRLRELGPQRVDDFDWEMVPRIEID